MLPLRIIIGKDTVTAILRKGESSRMLRSEAIIDVNHDGRWIRGIEFVGGIDFDLEKAVAPFAPSRALSGQSSEVSYDVEADASFISFQMKAHAPERSLKYSHSLTPDAELAFDELGGLLWVMFSPTEANNNTADFVSLIDTEIAVMR